MALTLEEKVREQLVAGDVGAVPAVDTCHKRPLGVGELGEFENDLRDWGLVYGMAYGIARSDDLWASRELIAERAYAAALGVYAAWSGNFHEKPARDKFLQGIVDAVRAAERVGLRLPDELETAVGDAELELGIESDTAARRKRPAPSTGHQEAKDPLPWGRANTHTGGVTMSTPSGLPDPDDVVLDLFEDAERLARVCTHKGVRGMTPDAIAQIDKLRREGLAGLLRLCQGDQIALHVTIDALPAEAARTALALAMCELAEEGRGHEPATVAR